MDILVQKPIFCHSSEFYEPPPSDYFTPYNTPPYITGAASGSWLGEQMQYLRFPTPPITPPRIVVPVHVPLATQSETRESVIMKCTKSSSSGSGSGSGSRSPTESCSEQSSGSECDFNCNWQDCGRVFESLEALAQHVTLRHAIASLLDGLYYCRWGGCQRSERGFNARYKMLVHVRTHTKEKPHRCHLCEKSFSRAENLKIHIRSHSGEKPYKCHFEGCQKAYSNSSDRFKHTRTHSMEKPYMCKVPGCQKRYTDPSSLRKHVKTFKHSIQLIASQSSTCLLDATEHSSSYTCLPLTAPVSVSVPLSTSCVESSPSSRCYDSDNVASDYSLRAKHHNEYTSSDYWLHPREHSYRYLHSEDYAMNMDLDTPTPLDLRIHRS
ncbi:zinc finger protein GLIS2 homolog isoform X2 [Drosophila innubila]|uniref:zinc finger protein GLIS2 homolog isoform X2 n=1 Tax=Drosophila innubila TaxID=198719 RepID=UPI00148C8A71|nr:zinc finger protein GLIS2 homolog isoform X2 [Drosophila innubila]